MNPGERRFVILYLLYKGCKIDPESDDEELENAYKFVKGVEELELMQE